MSTFITIEKTCKFTDEKETEKMSAEEFRDFMLEDCCHEYYEANKNKSAEEIVDSEEASNSSRFSIVAIER